eukprot:gene11872-5199_t
MSPKSKKTEQTKDHQIKTKGIFQYWDSPEISKSISLLNMTTGDVLVLPSMTFDPEELSKVNGISLYEERQLFNILTLQHNSNLKIIFVTSSPVDQSITKYYYDLIESPKEKFEDYQKRIKFISPRDSTSFSLTEKLLERPHFLKKLKNEFRNPEKTCIVPFVSTYSEGSLSAKLGIPVLGSHPKFGFFGTKEGGKMIFKEANVPYPVCTPLCKDVKQLFKEMLKLIKTNPKMSLLMVKLNDSFSGKGNAIMNLKPIQKLLQEEEEVEDETLLKAIEEECHYLRFESTVTWDIFSTKIKEMGCLAELYIQAKNAPSCQGYNSDSDCIIISTHDQILGGREGQCYLGCSFPCDEKYREKVQNYTKKIGEALVSKGVHGNFGVDFLVSDVDDEVYALEINLRVTGTTHPTMNMMMLIKGHFDFESGNYISKTSGKKKFYVSSDNVENKRFKQFLPEDMIEILKDNKLHFSSKYETGSIFHLLGTLCEFGKLGITSIGNSMEEARECYSNTVDYLNEYAENDFQ